MRDVTSDVLYTQGSAALCVRLVHVEPGLHHVGALSLHHLRLHRVSPLCYRYFDRSLFLAIICLKNVL